MSKRDRNRNFLGPSGTSLGLGEFWVLTLAGFTLFFAVWAGVAASGWLPPNLLPSPAAVWDTLVRLWRQPFAGHVYAEHLTASIWRFLMGWAIAVAVGIPLGLLMGWYRLLDEIVTPLFDAMRFVAPLAWVPLAALWFGTGIGGPLLIIFVGAFAPCVISAYRGARLVETRLVEAAQTLGASSRQVMVHVLIPGALPSIIAGLRVSAGLGWQSLVGSELIVVGAGLGYLMVQGQGNLATSVVIAGMIGIGVVGFALDVLLRAGMAFTVKPLLRAAIVLLGLQVTLGALVSLGPAALLLAFVVVAATLPATIWLGARLGVDPALSQLIGAGTAICGASAIVAANQVARGRDEDVAYALAVITLCGTAALLLFPVLADLLALTPHAFGLWAGAAIHEVVQAVGAAAAGGPDAAQSGTVMKLARVVLLAPAILALGWFLARRNQGHGQASAPMPWFAFGFVGLVLLGSTGWLPAIAADTSRTLVPLLLAASVVALGISTDLRALRRRGVRPLLLGVAATLFISGLAFAGILLIG